jgi:hypothetical protein
MLKLVSILLLIALLTYLATLFLAGDQMLLDRQVRVDLAHKKAIAMLATAADLVVLVLLSPRNRVRTSKRRVADRWPQTPP